MSCIKDQACGETATAALSESSACCVETDDLSRASCIGPAAAAAAADTISAARSRQEIESKSKCNDGAGKGQQKRISRQGKKENKAEKEEKGGEEEEENNNNDDDGAAGTNVVQEYVTHRISVWDKIAARRDAEERKRPIKQEDKILISMPDGKQVEGIAGLTTPLALINKLADHIPLLLGKKSIVAKVNDNQLWDLTRPLESSCKLEVLGFESPEGRHVFWHSSAHILGQAMEKQFVAAKLCVGPPVKDGDGFYYDAEMGDQRVLPSHYKSLDRTIKAISKAKQLFQRLVLHKDEAMEMFKYNPFKQELIRTKVPDGETCTAYRCGPFIDLCK